MTGPAGRSRPGMKVICAGSGGRERGPLSTAMGDPRRGLLRFPLPRGGDFRLRARQPGRPAAARTHDVGRDCGVPRRPAPPGPVHSEGRAVLASARGEPRRPAAVGHARCFRARPASRARQISCPRPVRARGCGRPGIMDIAIAAARAASGPGRAFRRCLRGRQASHPGTAQAVAAAGAGIIADPATGQLTLHESREVRPLRTDQ